VKPRLAWWIFIVGVVLLGFAYGTLKSSLEPWLFFALAIAYLVVLRLVAEVLDRKLRKRIESGGA
jgi:hypothetical protein